MRILKYKKGKKNTYLVQIDEEQYTLYDDIIIKYNLLLKKEITKSELKQIIKENSNLECYYKAINYLNIKMRSKEEIKKYLQKLHYQDSIITSVIEKLEKEKYLNMEEYVEAYVNDFLRFSKFGPNKIKDNLKAIPFIPFLSISLFLTYVGLNPFSLL